MPEAVIVDTLRTPIGRAFKGSLAQLRHLMRTTVTVRTRGEAAEVRNWPGVHDADFGDGQVRFSVERDELESTMGRLTRLGIVELTVAPASLEDLFLREFSARARAILPVSHYHGVFTLPEDLRPLARKYSREIYGALFQCTTAALLEMAESRLGVRLGLTLVLHTWTRDLRYHPHLHALITAGGLALDGQSFKRIRKKVLLHVKPLADLFKGKLMDALRQLKEARIIPMSDGAFGTLMASLQGQDWVVYLKRSFHGPEGTLQYLGRYTHRVGITNSRLLDVSESKVTFRTKDGRIVSLKPVAFLQRFVQHVLPDRFKKIRHAGLYAAPKALALAVKDHQRFFMLAGMPDAFRVGPFFFGFPDPVRVRRLAELSAAS